MRLLSLGLKLPVAAGMEWQLPRGAREVKEALRRFARKSYGRIQGTDGDVAIGEDLGDGDPPAKAYCGAALISLVAPDAFVFHQLPVDPKGDPEDEPEAWICGLRGGLPLPGFDAVLPLDEARARYNEFVSFNSSAQVYGSVGEARESLEDLLTKLAAKQRKSTLLVKTGIGVGTIVALILLPILVGAAVVAYVQMEATRERERISRQELLQRELAAATQRAHLAELRARFDREVADKRAEVEAQSDPAERLDAWIDVLSSKVPLSHNGWQPLSANCVKAVCTIRWRSAMQALPTHILELPGKLEAPDLITPSTTLESAVVPTSARKKVRKSFNLDLLSFAKATGTIVLVTINGDPQTIRVSPHKDLQAQGVTPVVVGTVGRFQATFTNLVALREFVRWAQPYALEVERLDATAFAPNVGAASYQVHGLYVLEEPTQ